MALGRRAEVEYLVEDIQHDLREVGGDGRDERGDLVRGDEDDAEDDGREAPDDLAAALVLHGTSDRRVRPPLAGGEQADADEDDAAAEDLERQLQVGVAGQIAREFGDAVARAADDAGRRGLRDGAAAVGQQLRLDADGRAQHEIVHDLSFPSRDKRFGRRLCASRRAQTVKVM